MTKLIEVTLPICLTNNNAGQGRSWHKSANDRKKFEQVLRANNLVRSPFCLPVAVEVIRNIGPRQRWWDADSILRGSVKGLLDAMTACGWFVDDKPEHIVQVVGSQRVLMVNGRRLPASCTIRVFDQPAVFQ
jgi:hypothetical protein